MSEKPKINFIRLKTLNSYEIRKALSSSFCGSQRQPKPARVKGFKSIVFWGWRGDKLMKLMFEYQNISK